MDISWSALTYVIYWLKYTFYNSMLIIIYFYFEATSFYTSIAVLMGTFMVSGKIIILIIHNSQHWKEALTPSENVTDELLLKIKGKSTDPWFVVYRLCDYMIVSILWTHVFDNVRIFTSRYFAKLLTMLVGQTPCQLTLLEDCLNKYMNIFIAVFHETISFMSSISPPSRSNTDKKKCL